MKARRRTSRKKAAPLYRKSDWNFIADALIHPLAEKNEGFILVDEILHMLIERNPALSVEKFFRYSFPRLVKRVRTAKDV